MFMLSLKFSRRDSSDSVNRLYSILADRESITTFGLGSDKYFGRTLRLIVACLVVMIVVLSVNTARMVLFTCLLDVTYPVALYSLV